MATRAADTVFIALFLSTALLVLVLMNGTNSLADDLPKQVAAVVASAGAASVGTGEAAAAAPPPVPERQEQQQLRLSLDLLKLAAVTERRQGQCELTLFGSRVSFFNITVAGVSIVGLQALAYLDLDLTDIF